MLRAWLRKQADLRGDDLALRFKRLGGWEERSWNELLDAVEKVVDATALPDSDYEALLLFLARSEGEITTAVIHHAEKLVLIEQLNPLDEAFAARELLSPGSLLYTVIPWLLTGFRLSIPETQATAENDRLEIEPTFVAEDLRTYQQWFAGVRERLPPHNGVWRRFLEQRLVDDSWLGQILVRQPLRKLLGFRRTRLALVFEGTLQGELQDFYAGLSVPVKYRPYQQPWPQVDTPIQKLDSLLGFPIDELA